MYNEMSQNQSTNSNKLKISDKSPNNNSNMRRSKIQAAVKKSHQNGNLQSANTKNNHTNSSKELDEDTTTTTSVPNVKVSNIIGDFGPYQISVVIFAALRAMCCALDGLSGPFVLPNIRNYQCEVCDIYSSRYSGFNNATDGSCSVYLGGDVRTRYDLDSTHCYFTNPDSLRQDRFECNKWTFNSTENDSLMRSLTIEQSLICDRDWLRSMTNSMYYVGATFGLLFWGIISDRYGRKTAYVCSHFVTLIFGFSALFANNMLIFIILRSINAFGMIGELIPRSIQVEIVATEYRFVCSVICQIGWAIGIILVPTLAYYNSSYKFILAFPVIISVLMLPWLIYLPESARWLIANENYPRARNELRRAAAINGKMTDDIDSKIEQFNRQVLHEEVGVKSGPRKRIGISRSILAIFTNVNLLKDTMSVFVLIFLAEVVYFSLTLNVADLGGSLYINYVISGISELVSIACCAFLLANLSRRMCLTLLLLLSTISYLMMALVNIYEDSLSMTLILSVNAFGKLTAIGNLMVIILVAQEVYPTVIRQFGTSLCITVGKAGSAVAPFTHELGLLIKQSYCFGVFSVICLSCAIIPFGLSETGNRELPDTVIDVEEGDNNKRLNDRRKELAKKEAAQNIDYGTNRDNNYTKRNGIEGKSYRFNSESGKQIDNIKQIVFEDNNNNSIDESTKQSAKNDINLDVFSTSIQPNSDINQTRTFVEDENNNTDLNYEQAKKSPKNR